MVNLGIIRRKKAKKIIALVGAGCAALLAILVAVALLGQHAAPLTVVLNNSGATLSLSETNNDSDDKTSFLLAKDVPGYQEIDGKLLDKYGDAYLDSEQNTESIIASTEDEYKVTLIFKYTFFLENNGDQDADYLLTLNISHPNGTSNEFDLADILRIRFYENFDLSEHNYKTYAKASSVFDEESNQYIAVPAHVTDLDSDYAEMFESNRVALTSEVKNFAPGEKVRYTFVMWLEGNDPDSYGKTAPVNSSIALGVNISAHESEGESSETSSEEITSE